MRLLVFALMMTASTITYAQTGFLAGIGAGYGKDVTANLIAGVKIDKASLYYDQVAYVAADKPAYFGLSAGYDIYSNYPYHITVSAGGAFRKQSSDVKGKEGGNYWVASAGVAFNKGPLSITVRYMGHTIHAGLLFSGLLTGNE